MAPTGSATRHERKRPPGPALGHVPQASPPERGALPRQGRHSREGLRHLAVLHRGGEYLEQARLIALGLGGARVPARRQDGDRGRQPSPAVLGDARHPGAGRRARPALPGLHREGDGVHRRPRGGPLRRSWRTRSRSTSSSRCRRGARGSSTSSTTTPAGSGTTRTPASSAWRLVQELGPAVRSASTPATSSGRWPRARRTTSRSSATRPGTTGQPKGTMLSFRNLIVTGRNAIEYEGLRATDEVVAYLPMAWIGDHMFSFAQSILTGFTTNCPESTATVLQDLREIGPTYFFAPPGIYQRILTTAMIRIEDSARDPSGGMVRFFLDVARRVERRRLAGKPVPPGERLLHALGRVLVYGPLRDNLGMSQVRLAYTAGEAIGPELFEFYRALGVNMKQLYGMTESSALICIQRDGEVRLDTVGHAADRTSRSGSTSRARCSTGARGLRRLLQESRGDPADDRGRLGPFRGRRDHRQGRAPPHHRPRPRRRAARGRDAVRAEVPGEQAEVLALHPRGGLRRPGPAVRRRAPQHRRDRGRELGRAAGPRLHELHGPLPEARGLRARPRGGRAHEPEPPRGASAPRRADAPLPDAPQGARPRRPGDHPDPQGAPRVHRPEVRRAGGGPLLGRRTTSRWRRRSPTRTGGPGTVRADVRIREAEVFASGAPA